MLEGVLSLFGLLIDCLKRLSVEFRLNRNLLFHDSFKLKMLVVLESQMLELVSNSALLNTDLVLLSA